MPSEPHPGLPLAQHLAIASRLVYLDPAVVRAELMSDLGYDHAQFFDATFIGDSGAKRSTQCVVAVDSDRLLLCFRGSQDLEDWIVNLKFRTVNHPFGAVHRGFEGALDSVWTEVLELLREWKRPGQVFSVTGHSLGGALGVLATTRLAGEPALVPDAIHTFGQPRVGDKRFTTTFDDRFKTQYLRFVNRRDLVSRLPPWYPHCGTLMHFNRHGELTVDSGKSSGGLEDLGGEEGELPPLTEERLAELQAQLQSTEAQLEGVIPGVAHHAIDRYIELIGKAMEG